MNPGLRWQRPSPRSVSGRRKRSVSTLLMVMLGVAGACKNEPTPIEPSAATTTSDNQAADVPASLQQLPSVEGIAVPEPAALPPGHPPITPPTSAAVTSTRPVELPPVPPPVLGTEQTKLEGITLTVPRGWVAQPVRPVAGMPAALAPKAVYRLAVGPGDPNSVSVRVSRFPEMRAMENMVQSNLNRWYDMFQQPDGRPTAQVARTEVLEVGPCRVTVTHVTGDMDHLRNQGMIGAIIEHPSGPFFVKANGSVAGIEAWKPHILLYLQSIRASEPGTN